MFWTKIPQFDTNIYHLSFHSVRKNVLTNSSNSHKFNCLPVWCRFWGIPLMVCTLYNPDSCVRLNRIDVISTFVFIKKWTLCKNVASQGFLDVCEWLSSIYHHPLMTWVVLAFQNIVMRRCSICLMPTPIRCRIIFYCDNVWLNNSSVSRFLSQSNISSLSSKGGSPFWG